MTFRTIGRIVLALLLVVLCSGIGVVLMILNPSVQRYGLRHVSQEIGFDLNTGTIRLSMGKAPGIHIQDVQVSSKEGKILLTASELILLPNLFDLFPSGSGAVFPAAIEAKNLKFQLGASGEIKDYALPQVTFQAKYDLNKQRLQIHSLKIIAPESSLSATGQIQFNPPASPTLDLTVSSPFMSVDNFKSLLPAFFLPDWIGRELLPAIKKGDIRIDTFSLQGSMEQIETLNQPGQAKVLGLNLTLSNLVLQPPERNAPELRDISGALRIQDGVFSLNGLAGRFWQSAFQNTSIVIPSIHADRMRYLIRTEAAIFLSDVIHLKDLPLFPADIQQQIMAINEIDGTADIRASLEYETGQPFPKIISSSVSLQSTKVNHPLLRLPLTLGTATVDSASDQPTQFSGSGFWGKSEFQVQGSADSAWKHMNAKATTRADVGELIGLALPHAALGTWRYGPLVAEGALDDDGITLDPARIEAGKGYLRFKGRQNYLSSTGMRWISHIHIVQEPAKNLIQLFQPGVNLMDGSVTMEGVLTLKDTDGTGKFSGLNGHARLLVENGWIHQTNPILNALALISLERIFKPGSAGVQDGRLNFDRIEGDIEIEKGKVLVQNLTFHSQAINAAGAGTIDLNRELLQMKIGLQPLGTVDSLVSSIPLIGNVLTGKDKSLIVYSLEVTGSLSNPQVKSVPLKNIGESALGYVERMVFTPERILKSLLAPKDPRPAVPDYHAEFDRMPTAP